MQRGCDEGPVGDGVLGREQRKGRLVEGVVALGTLKLVRVVAVAALVTIECCWSVVLAEMQTGRGFQ